MQKLVEGYHIAMSLGMYPFFMVGRDKLSEQEVVLYA
jgi:hypothetical protein